MNSFGSNIRELRLLRGLSQVELSKALNVAKGTVSNWENNNRFPDKNMLIKLSTYFNVSIDSLLGFELKSQSNSIYPLPENSTRDLVIKMK